MPSDMLPSTRRPLVGLNQGYACEKKSEVINMRPISWIWELARGRLREAAVSKVTLKLLMVHRKQRMPSTARGKSEVRNRRFEVENKFIYRYADIF